MEERTGLHTECLLLKPSQGTWAPGVSRGLVGCYIGFWKLSLGD